MYSNKRIGSSMLYEQYENFHQCYYELKFQSNNLNNLQNIVYFSDTKFAVRKFPIRNFAVRKISNTKL